MTMSVESPETAADGPVRQRIVWIRSVPDVLNWRSEIALDGGLYAPVEQYEYAFLDRPKPSSSGHQRRK